MHVSSILLEKQINKILKTKDKKWTKRNTMFKENNFLLDRCDTAQWQIQLNVRNKLKHWKKFKWKKEEKLEKGKKWGKGADRQERCHT